MGRYSNRGRRTSKQFNAFLGEARTRLQKSQIKNIPKKNSIMENLINYIPAFDAKKETNINFYITQFEEAATHANIAKEIRLVILKSKLTGVAREKLQADAELHSETDYEKFKEKLRNIFGSKLSFGEAHDNFSKLKQSPTETINDFITRFNTEAAKVFEISGLANKNDAKKLFELMKLHKFTDAVKSDIAFEIRKKDIQTFNEATETARVIEAAINSTNFAEVNNINRNDTTEFCQNLIQQNKLQAENMAKLQLELENLKLAQQNREKKNSSDKEKYCEICKRTNHTVQDCRYKNSNQTFHRNNFRSNFPKFKQLEFPGASAGNFSGNFQGYGFMPNWNSSTPLHVTPPPVQQLSYPNAPFPTPSLPTQHFAPNFYPYSGFQNCVMQNAGASNPNFGGIFQNQSSDDYNQQNWKTHQNKRKTGNKYENSNSDKNENYQKKGSRSGNGRGGL